MAMQDVGSIPDQWYQVFKLQKGDLGLLGTSVLDSYCQGIVRRPRISFDVIFRVIKVLK
jgi:hypothetical protein